MKRILAISWEMPPLSGPRAVQVTRTLVTLGERGWRSRVVCFGPRSTRYQQDYHLDVEAISNGAVTRVPVPSAEERLHIRALWRVLPPLKHLPDEKRVWIDTAVAAATRLLDSERADIIVSFAQPWSDHLIGLRLHRQTGLPWVAHFSDPWVDSPYQQGAGRHQPRRLAMERSVMEAASRVVFVNQQTADRVMAKYPAAWRERARVVPQGFVATPATPRPLRAGPLRVVYTGRFYPGVRGPETFFEALNRIDRAEPLQGRLIVDVVGGDMTRYQRLAGDRGLGGIVRFAGRVSPERALAIAAEGDVLLVIDAPSEGPSLFLPSKLVDYLPLARPILAMTPSEGATADLLSALGYPIADPRDVEAIAILIRRLLDAHSSGDLKISPQHYDVSRAYDIRETTNAFEQVLLEATNS